MRTTVTRLITLAALSISAPLRAQSYPPLHVDPTLKECSVEFASTLTQSAYRRFAREFGSVSAFKQQQMAPGTLGKGRVSIAFEMMSFSVDDKADAWNDTFAHPNDHHPLGETHNFPKIEARFGVTNHFNVGAFYTRNPEANYGWAGLDGKYTALDEAEGAPVSVAMRGAYTKTLYVHDMDMHAVTADVSVGRTLWGMFKPYVGVGADGILARETSQAVSLKTESSVVPHTFGGLDVTLWGRVTVGAEYTRGVVPSSHVQVSATLF